MCSQNIEESGPHILSTDKVSDNEPRKHHFRSFAIYEKQLFCEKMISACYQLRTWQCMLHRTTVDIKRFREIWMDSTKLHFSSTVDMNAWIPSDRRQAIEEENRRSDLVRRPGMIWQNFDISLKVPGPSYNDEHFWFKIDECSKADKDFRVPGKTFFCTRCENVKDVNTFCRDGASFRSDYLQFPEHCIGCTYKHALSHMYYQINAYKELRGKMKRILSRAQDTSTPTGWKM